VLTTNEILFFTARICFEHFSDNVSYKSLQQKLLVYCPTNRRRLLTTAIPTKRSPPGHCPPVACLAVTPDKRATETIRSKKVKKNRFVQQNRTNWNR
jgi:hypothetical protein